MKLIVVIILIFLVLVTLDKGLTVLNIIQVKKHFPGSVAAQDYNIEKNPVARWFFKKVGLWVGTLVYLVLSLASLVIAYIFISKIIGHSWTLYGLIMFYGLVIVNNLYFLLKYSRVIP